MRSLRKLTYVGLAALMLCLAVAASASADKLTVTSSGGALVPSGTAISGTSTSTVLTGSFFGNAQTITCSGSAINGVTTSTNAAGANVTGNITSISFTGCFRTGGATQCTVSSNASSSNTALLSGNANVGATSGTTTVNMNNVTVSVGACILGGAMCTFTGAGAAPTNSLSGTFSSPLGLQFTNAALKSPTFGCGNGSWSGNYTTVRSSDGAALYGTGT
jgi:hypothetical protein